jgi:hypothetical protein
MNSSRVLTGLVVLGVLTLAGLGYWYHVIRTTSAELERIEAELATQSTHVGGVPANGSQLRDDEHAVQEYFVSGEDVPAFINDLEARGRRQGAKVTTASVAKTGSGEDTALTLSLVIRGSFDQVSRTVGAIEYAPYALTVTSLAVVREINKEWRADLKLTVGSPPPLVTP